MAQNSFYILDLETNERRLFEIGENLLINFSNNTKIDEYCIVFENTEHHQNLYFELDSEIELYCYWKHEYTDGTFKYRGYDHIKGTQFAIDISDSNKYFLFIPRNNNEEIKTLLTLRHVESH